MMLQQHEWYIACGSCLMLVASKGLTKLEINFTDEVKVRVGSVLPELRITAAAIAKSIRSLLQYELKYNASSNKEKVVVSYLEKLGWRIDNSGG